MQKEIKIRKEVYTIVEILQDDLFRTILKGKDNKENYVVIKIMNYKQDIGVSKNIIREIAILKKIKNDNIIKIIDFDFTEKQILMCLEYVDCNLNEFWEFKFNGMTPEIELIKNVMFQIFNACNYLHENGIVHRNIRPQNIFMKNGEIKIADFELSRLYSIPINQYTKDISTIWYRAPELLNAEYYTIGVDIWSIGCIMIELFIKKPFFMYQNESEKLSRINKIFSNTDTLEKILLNENIPNKAVDLILKLLQYDSIKRMSCKDALKHDFFVTSS